MAVRLVFFLRLSRRDDLLLPPFRRERDDSRSRWFPRSVFAERPIFDVREFSPPTALLLLLFSPDDELAARPGYVGPHRPADGAERPVRRDDALELPHMLLARAAQLVLHVRLVVGDEIDHEMPSLAKLTEPVSRFDRRRITHHCCFIRGYMGNET